MLADDLVGNHRVIALKLGPWIRQNIVARLHAQTQQNSMCWYGLLRTALQCWLIQNRLKEWTSSITVEQSQCDCDLRCDETSGAKSVAKVVEELVNAPILWVSNPPPAVVSGANYVVTNTPTGGQRFYRLKK